MESQRQGCGFKLPCRCVFGYTLLWTLSLAMVYSVSGRKVLPVGHLLILGHLLICSPRESHVANMTPLWIFPACPLLLTDPVASNLISSLPDAAFAARINSTAIAYGAVCVQGIGFLLSFMIYSDYSCPVNSRELWFRKRSERTDWRMVGEKAEAIRNCGVYTR